MVSDVEGGKREKAKEGFRVYLLGFRGLGV